jgi:hypothetical protein
MENNYIHSSFIGINGSERGLYEYKFVKVDLEGFLISAKRPSVDHHRLIEEHARDGWKLVQIFAPAVSVISGGTPDYFEIIFEREKRG